MICTVMQPYIFPYIGYYQLVMLSDFFISYDDVTFIKQGYINRNSLLVMDETYRFTIPVQGASSNRFIKDLTYGNTGKLIKTIEQAYSKARFFDEVFDLIHTVLTNHNRSVALINKLSIELVFQYLGVNKYIISSSQIDFDRTKDRSDRLIELCKYFGCNQYVNPISGGNLYDKEYFYKKGISLGLLKTEACEYEQFNSSVHQPYLSIIDLMMNCDKSEILKLLGNYKVYY